jgi:hypothetical protein
MNDITNFKMGIKPTMLLKWLLLLCIIIIYTSCSRLKEDFDFSKITPQWNSELAVPLVNSTLYISDFLKDSSNLNIVVNPDQSLSFIYSSDSVLSVTAGSFMNLPDQEFDFSSIFDVSEIPPGDYDTTNIVYIYQFINDTVNQKLDSIFLSDGILSISGQTNLNHDVATLVFKVDDIKNIETGEPLTMFVDLNNSGGQNDWVYFESSFDLSSYKIILNESSDTLENAITFVLDVIIQGDENPNLSPYDIIVGGSLKSLEFNSAFGYIGQYELQFVDSLDIGIFDAAVTGGINIGDGSINLTFDISNSIGTPVMFEANSLYVESTVTPPYHVDINLFGPDIPNVFSINSPEITQIGDSVETHLDFTQANFHEAFNISPQFLYYDFTAITNFEGDSADYNFILNESAISFNVDLEFELFGSVENFTLQDTIALDFEDDVEELESMLFRFNLTNGFPISVSAQIYFVDDNYLVLDSLMANGTDILQGAITSGSPDYRVTESVNKITDILIDRSRFSNILNSDYLIFKTSLSTSDQQLVKIYEDYNIEIRLGTILELKIDTEN